MNNVNHYHLKTPTIITTLKLGTPKELREKWAKEAYNLNSFSYETNLKSQMSSYHIWEETKLYNELIDNLQTTINNTRTKINIIPKDHGFWIWEAWSAVYKESEYALEHSHNKSSLAFCYYIKVGNNTTPLVFNELPYKIIPEDDMLIIFDANLKHSVPPHVGEDRIVLAGNCLIVPKEYLNEPRPKSPTHKQ